jgi:hypothetical protein
MLANLKKVFSKEDIKCRRFYFKTNTFLSAPSAWKSLIAKKLFNKKCLFYHVAQSSARSFSYRHN